MGNIINTKPIDLYVGDDGKSWKSVLLEQDSWALKRDLLNDNCSIESGEVVTVLIPSGWTIAPDKDGKEHNLYTEDGRKLGIGYVDGEYIANDKDRTSVVFGCPPLFGNTYHLPVTDRRPYHPEKSAGQKLQGLRLAAGLSQSQLAEKSGVPVRNIRAYEIGQRDLNKTEAIKVLMLAKALNTTVENLLEN